MDLKTVLGLCLFSSVVYGARFTCNSQFISFVVFVFSSIPFSFYFFSVSEKMKLESIRDSDFDVSDFIDDILNSSLIV